MPFDFLKLDFTSVSECFKKQPKVKEAFSVGH